MQDNANGNQKPAPKKQHAKGYQLKNDPRILAPGTTLGAFTVDSPTDGRAADGSRIYAVTCNVCGQSAEKTAKQMRTAKSCGCIHAAYLKENRGLSLGATLGTRLCAYTDVPNRNSTTGAKGVFPAPGGKYRACVMYHGKRHDLGTFASIEDAARARQLKVQELLPDLEEQREVARTRLDAVTGKNRGHAKEGS